MSEIGHFMFGYGRLYSKFRQNVPYVKVKQPHIFMKMSTPIQNKVYTIYINSVDLIIFKCTAYYQNVRSFQLNLMDKWN